MTPEQFKSWFEGFTEALSGPPNEEQWQRIKAQVAAIQVRPAVTLREIDPNSIRRTWDYGQVTCGSPTGRPMPDRGHVTASTGDAIPQNVKSFVVPAERLLSERGYAGVKEAWLKPEFGGTRVVDVVSGADLGRAD